MKPQSKNSKDPLVRLSQLKATEDRLRTEISQMGKSVKKELKIDFEASLSASVVRMGMQFDDFKYEMEQKAQKRHSELFNLVDGLAGEIKDNREFRTIITDQVADCSHRLDKVEMKVFNGACV